jgi:hypothetical protein
MSAIWPMSMPQLLEVTRNTSVRCSRPTTTASVGSSIPPAAPEHRSRRTPDVFGPDPAPFPLVESGSDELSPELVVTKLFEAVEWRRMGISAGSWPACEWRARHLTRHFEVCERALKRL